MEFQNTFTAYEWLVNDAQERGYSKAEIARTAGFWAQQITNTIQTKKVKLESVKSLAEAMGYEVKIVLIKKS